MINREMLISALHCRAQDLMIDPPPCDGCDYQTANYRGCDIRRICKDALDLLKEQENRWVSVKDRMPDEAGKYYVSGGGKVWFGEMMCLGGMKGWINSAKNPNVEAWMPQPEAYKKRGEAE